MNSWQVQSMLAAWKKRLKAAIDDRGWKPTPLSEQTTKSHTFVRDIFDKDTDPRVSGVLELLKILRVSASEIFDGDELPKPEVQVVGYSGGGEEWIPVDQSAQGAGVEDPLILDLSDADPIAIRVRGHSMAPVYRDGDYLICSRRRGTNIDEAVNQDCIVLTMDDRCFIKRLAKGAARRTYSLRSYNPAYPDLEDERLQWAAPVIWIKRV